MCSLKERKRTKKNGEKNAVPNPALNLKKTRVYVSQKRADFEWHEHGHEQVLKVHFLKKIVSVFRYCMLIKLRACPDEFNDLSVFTFDLHLTDLWVCIQRTHSSDIVSSKCTLCSVYKSHHYVLFDLYSVQCLLTCAAQSSGGEREPVRLVASGRADTATTRTSWRN